MEQKHSFNNFLNTSGSLEDLPDWVSVYPEFHIQVKAIREYQGISQQKLAENVGLTWRSIPNIESGKVNPKISTLKNIADYLNCELKILLIPCSRLKKPGGDHTSSVKDGHSPLQKDLSFDKRSETPDADEDQFRAEKKKEYFWD